jgi:hypothetical protein
LPGFPVKVNDNGCFPWINSANVSLEMEVKATRVVRMPYRVSHVFVNVTVRTAVGQLNGQYGITQFPWLHESNVPIDDSSQPFSGFRKLNG